MNTFNPQQIDAEVNRLGEMGISTIPLAPGGKAPKISGWSGMRIRTAEEFRAVAQQAYGPSSEKSGIGVLLGEASGGLICVDLDDPVAVELASDHIPETASSGRESAPNSHRFFLCPELDSKAYFKGRSAQGETKAHIELLTTGQQVVAGPSLHPSGEQWSPISGVIQEANARHLKMCMDNLNDAVCNAKGWIVGEAPVRQAAPVELPKALPGSSATLPSGFEFDSNSMSSPLEQLKEFATESDVFEVLSYFGWKRDARVQGKQHYIREGKEFGVSGNYSEHYRVFSCFTSSSVIAQGDYGYTDLLCLQQGIDARTLVEAIRGTEKVKLVPVNFGPTPSPGVNAVKVPVSVSDYPEPGGWISAYADYLDSIARRPSRQLAIAGAMTALGAVVARKAVVEGQFLSLYTSVVAKSGRGKDIPLKATQNILKALGQVERISESTGSAYTFDELTLRYPATVIESDENAVSGKSGTLGGDIANRMRTAYSVKPGDSMMVKSTGKNQKKKHEDKQIVSPSVTWISAITPDAFLEMSGESLELGNFGRMLSCLVLDYPKPKHRSEMSLGAELPSRLVEALRPWHDSLRVNHAPYSDSSKVAPSGINFTPDGEPIEEDADYPLEMMPGSMRFIDIEYTPEALELLGQHEVTTFYKTDERLIPAYSRAAQQAARYAGLHAISLNPSLVERTVIGTESVQWAVDLSVILIENLVSFLGLSD